MHPLKKSPTLPPPGIDIGLLGARPGMLFGGDHACPNNTEERIGFSLFVCKASCLLISEAVVVHPTASLDSRFLQEAVGFDG